jgi:hypothetical protein
MGTELCSETAKRASRFSGPHSRGRSPVGHRWVVSTGPNVDPLVITQMSMDFMEIPL